MNNTSADYKQAPRFINRKADKLTRFCQCESLIKTIAAHELNGNAYKYFDRLTGTSGDLNPGFNVSEKWMFNQTGLKKNRQSEARQELLAKGFISHSEAEFLQIEYHNILMLYGMKYYQKGCYTLEELEAIVAEYEYHSEYKILFKKDGADEATEINPDAKRQNMYRGTENRNPENRYHNIEYTNIKDTTSQDFSSGEEPTFPNEQVNKLEDANHLKGDLQNTEEVADGKQGEPVELRRYSKTSPVCSRSYRTPRSSRRSKQDKASELPPTAPRIMTDEEALHKIANPSLTNLWIDRHTYYDNAEVPMFDIVDGERYKVFKDGRRELVGWSR